MWPVRQSQMSLDLWPRLFSNRSSPLCLSPAPNKKVVNSLPKASIKDPLSIDRLVIEASPRVSLADALEVLAERLHQQSNGLIDRIALFIDEFDRFVEPMMTDRRGEVEKMLWDLRKVVQMSNRIGLVLAGSGLQRVFVDGYDKALFSSIAQHELKPFDWELDQQASQATFMPERLRARLCNMDRFEELVGMLTSSVAETHTISRSWDTRRPSS